MEYGKQVCSHLKEIRRQIAKDNDIALDIPECTYQGECSGTCPRCEMELQILEKELTRRSLLGKAAMIAGVTVSLATCQNAMAQEPVSPQKQQTEQTDTNVFSLKGIVKESKWQEPLVGAKVILKKDGQMIKTVRTGIDGDYIIRNIKKGIYEIVVGYPSYKDAKTELDIERNPDGTWVKVFDFILERGPVLVQPSDVIIRGMPSPVARFLDKDAPSGQTFTSDQIEHFPTP